MTTPPTTPPSKRGRWEETGTGAGAEGINIKTSGGQAIHAKVSRVESGVPIWRTDSFVGLDENQKEAVRAEQLGIPGAFLLHNFFSSQECDDLVSTTEVLGYSAAKVSVYGGQMVSMDTVRKGSRLIWDTQQSWLEPLWERLERHLPELGISGYRPIELNNRLRFLKYEPGDYFKPHYDGAYSPGPKKRSFMTFIAYLNDVKEGGQTNFFKRSSGKKPAVSVAPRKGNAIIFFHDNELSPLHEGAEILSGLKYAVRTDVMYEKLRCSFVV